VCKKITKSLSDVVLNLVICPPNRTENEHLNDAQKDVKAGRSINLGRTHLTLKEK